MEVGAGSLVSNAARRRRHRAILLAALAIALAGSTGAWLATSGTGGPTITPPAGATGGVVATIDSTGLSGSITQSRGNAQVDDGLPVTKLLVANGYENQLRVHVTWTNGAEAGAFLHGQDQISIGLYHPVSVTSAGGSCTSANTLKVLDSTTTAGAVCVALDPASAGSFSFNSDTDTIMLSQSTLSGYLLPSDSAGSPSGSCPTDSAAQSAWCDPAGTTVDNTSGTPVNDQHALYVVASVLNPNNHSPHGQQPANGSLDFFVQADRTQS
ncbi:MAG: hypothetical protein ACRDLM_05800 [Gaiellaceae bacterium]